MLVALAAVLGSLLVVTPGSQTAAEAASTTACPDVFFLGARGSGQPEKKLGEEVKVLRNKIKQHISHREFDSEAVDYPAEDVWVLAPSAHELALLAAGKTRAAIRHWQEHRFGKYMGGLDEGVERAAGTLKDRSKRCPSERIVLAGYSQGAMVMHRVVNRLNKQDRGDILQRVAGVALIADGDRVGGSGASILGDPRAGRAGQGVAPAILGGGRDISHTRTRSRSLNLCTKNDIICDFRGAWSLLHWHQAKEIHKTYPSTTAMTELAKSIANVVMGWAVPVPRSPRLILTVGEPHSTQLKASARRGATFGWRQRSPLPPGLNLSPSGLLSGVPTMVGQWSSNFAVRANSSGPYSDWIPGSLMLDVRSDLPGPPVLAWSHPSYAGPWPNLVTLNDGGVVAAAPACGSTNVFASTGQLTRNIPNMCGVDVADPRGNLYTVTESDSGCGSAWSDTVWVFTGTTSFEFPTKDCTYIYELVAGADGNIYAVAAYERESGALQILRLNLDAVRYDLIATIAEQHRLPGFYFQVHAYEAGLTLRSVDKDYNPYPTIKLWADIYHVGYDGGVLKTALADQPEADTLVYGIEDVSTDPDGTVWGWERRFCPDGTSGVYQVHLVAVESDGAVRRWPLAERRCIESMAPEWPAQIAAAPFGVVVWTRGGLSAYSRDGAFLWSTPMPAPPDAWAELLLDSNGNSFLSSYEHQVGVTIVDEKGVVVAKIDEGRTGRVEVMPGWIYRNSHSREGWGSYPDDQVSGWSWASAGRYYAREY